MKVKDLLPYLVSDLDIIIQKYKKSCNCYVTVASSSIFNIRHRNDLKKYYNEEIHTIDFNEQSLVNLNINTKSLIIRLAKDDED